VCGQNNTDFVSLQPVHESTLSLIRSQVTQAIWRSCSKVSTSNCNVTLESDNFSCHSNTRLLYTARIVATDTVNATTFLNYLGMVDTINVLLNDGTSFRTSATNRSCSLSIPSPDEANCTISSSPPSSVNLPVDVASNKNTTSSPENDSGNGNDDNEEDEDSVAMVIAVAVGCSVGIVVMACFVMFTMFVCNRCNHCYDRNSR